jgi:protocatechuate 3,4-dioxygenase beta subunit
MKTFQKFLLSLSLVLTFNLRAATNEVANFSGTVVDIRGNPVGDATVDFYQYPQRTSYGPMEMEAKQHTTTDAQGAFAFPMFQGMGLVLVKKAGFAPSWQTWYNVPQEPAKIILGAPSALAGVVVDGAGQPVADAEVSVSSALNKTLSDIGQPNFISGKIARELFSARASADGKFRIENFPADAQAILSVKKNGLTLRQAAKNFQYNELPFHAGQEDITLTLEPAGSVTGKVVARGTGQSLVGAIVGLQPSASGMRYYFSDETTVVSAADGSFQISDVPAGAYTVIAVFTNQPIADWVADLVPVTVAAGETVSDVQMQAYKGGVVEVTVRGKNSHELIAGAGVSVNNQDYNRVAETDTNGAAYFRLPPGSFTVFANKQDWSQAQTQTAVTDGQTTQVTIELGEPFKLIGIVRDASGAAVVGANVGVFPNYGNDMTGTKTDTNGHYELTWQKPSWVGMGNQSYYLLARHAERKLAAIQEMDEAITNLDVTLKPTMSVSGRVQDTNGKMVTNMMAYVMLYKENTSFTVSRQPIHADEQGRISMDTLPLGERYGLSVSGHGYGSAQEEMDAEGPKADHYDFPIIVVKIADRKLAGRVLGTDGKPAVGAQIWMNGEGQPNGNAISDADGRFGFDAVCDGAVQISANVKGINGSEEAMGGDTNVVIRLNAANRVYMAATPQTLTGTVFDSSGNPTVGAKVVVTPSWGAINVAKTDASGEFSVGWQPEPGMRNAKYFTIARDVERNLAAIESIDTNKIRVTMRLEPALTLSGTVEDTNGVPLSRANINLNMMAGNMGGMVEYQTIKMNSDGTFTIPALPMGQQYNVYVNANGYGSAQKSIGKTQSQTNSIQLAPFKLKIADRQLAGQVLGADGKSLSGMQVNINGNGQPNGNTRTDATGHFKFKVCDGPIQIFAYSPSGGGRNNFGNASARGGDTNVVVKIGARQQQNPVAQRETPLKPQSWTLNALVTWPANHKTGAIILTSLQLALLLGIAGGIFWFTRKPA